MFYILFVGQQAARMMVSDGRKVAEGLQGPRRAEMLQLCGEVESLTDQLSDLCRKGMVRLRHDRSWEYICIWALQWSSFLKKD